MKTITPLLLALLLFSPAIAASEGRFLKGDATGAPEPANNEIAPPADNQGPKPADNVVEKPADSQAAKPSDEVAKPASDRQDTGKPANDKPANDVAKPAEKQANDKPANDNKDTGKPAGDHLAADGGVAAGARQERIPGPHERSCNVASRSGDHVEFACKAPGKKGDNLAPGGGGQAQATDAAQVDAGRQVVVNPQDLQDQIKYNVKTSNNGLFMDLKYNQQIDLTADANTTGQSKTTFNVGFDTIIEYVKSASSTSDSGEAYDWDYDQVVQAFPLTKWDKIPAVVNDDSGVVSYVTATAPIGEGDNATGQVEFKFTLSRQDLAGSLTANNMKIDVRIVDFPWTRSDSYVALLTTVDSKQKVTMDYNQTDANGKVKLAHNVSVAFEDDLSQVNFNTFGAYTWASNAQVLGSNDAVEGEANSLLEQDNNGTVQMGRRGHMNETMAAAITPTYATSAPTTGAADVDVIATSRPSLGNDTFQAIAFSFVGDEAHQASDIYWDPEVGVGYETTDASLLSASGGSSLAVVVPAIFTVVGAMIIGVAF